MVLTASTRKSFYRGYPRGAYCADYQYHYYLFLDEYLLTFTSVYVSQYIIIYLMWCMGTDSTVTHNLCFIFIFTDLKMNHFLLGGRFEV